MHSYDNIGIMIIKHLLSAGLTSIMLTGLIWCPMLTSTAQAIETTSTVNQTTDETNTNAEPNSDNASTETNANNNEAFSFNGENLTDEQIRSIVIHDNAEILSGNTTDWIITADKWFRMQDKTKNDDMTLAVYTNPEYTADDPQTDCTDAFNKFRIGSARTNQGVLLCVYPDSRKYAVSIGAGWNKYVQQDFSNDYIADNENIISLFRAGDYDNAVLISAKETVNRMYDNGDTLKQQEEAHEKLISAFDETMSKVIPIIIGVIMIGALIMIIMKIVDWRQRAKIENIVKSLGVVDGMARTEALAVQLGLSKGELQSLDENNILDYIQNNEIETNFQARINELIEYSYAGKTLNDYYPFIDYKDYLKKKKNYYYGRKIPYPIGSWKPNYQNIINDCNLEHDSLINSYENCIKAMRHIIYDSQDYNDVKYGVDDAVGYDIEIRAENNDETSLNDRGWLNDRIAYHAARIRFDRDYDDWLKQTDTPDRFKNYKFKEHLRDNNDFMNTYRNRNYNTGMALAWMNSVYSHDNIANDSSYQEPEYHNGFSSDYSSGGFSSDYSSSSSSYSGGCSDGGGFSGGW